MGHMTVEMVTSKVTRTFQENEDVPTTEGYEVRSLESQVTLAD